MGEIIGRMLLELDKLMPLEYRIRVVACSSFIGLGAWIYYSNHIYARSAEVKSDIVLAVAPLSVEMKQDERASAQRFLGTLSSQILEVAGRCSETKDPEARALYQASLSDLMERYEVISGHPFPNPSVVCP